MRALLGTLVVVLVGLGLVLGLGWLARRRPVRATPPAAPPVAVAPAAGPPAPTDQGTGVPTAGIVFVTEAGPDYHLEGCSRLRMAEAEPIEVEEARTIGYRPCAVCRPDEALPG